MIRLRSFLALLLALLWLPAKLHCELEAAGILAESCADDVGGGCTQDDCKTLEGSGYQATVPAIKLAPRIVLTCECLLQFVAPTISPAEPVEAPRECAHASDWVPAWQFEQRAAAPPHAPDWVIA